jgi:hypothetical protein
MDRKALVRVAVPGGLLLVGLAVGGVSTYFAKSTEVGTPVAAPLQTITETVEKTYTKPRRHPRR